MNATEFIKNNAFILLVVLVIAIVIVVNIIKNKRKIKVKFGNEAPKAQPPQEQIEEEIFGDGLFDEYDIDTTLSRQHKTAEKEIKQIQAEGKELLSQEQNLDKYFRENKMVLQTRRKNLYLKYTTWKTHLQKLDEMITNQSKLKEGLRK